MRIVPQALFSSSQEHKSEIAFKLYRTDTDREKAKIQLTHHVLVFLRSGEKLVYTDKETVRFSASSAFIIKKGKYIIAERLLKDKLPYESTLFFFSDHQIEHFISKYRLVKPKNIKSKRLIEIPFKPVYHHWLADYAQQFKTYELSFEWVALKIEEFFLSLHEDQSRATDLLFCLLEKPLKVDFIRLIDSKIHTTIHLEELAFLSNMSLSTFKRKFITELGMSAGTFIRKRKMEFAKTQILTRNAKGSDLFYDLGYKNHSSFITAFKREYGLSPEEYKMAQTESS